MIIGISGKARSGKDSVAEAVRNQVGAFSMAMSDPGKRFLRDCFGFTHEQLWGNKKEAQDLRFPLSSKMLAVAEAEHKAAIYRGDHDHVMETHLTPRRTFQVMLEGLRELYDPVWIDLVLSQAKLLLESEGTWYSPADGIFGSTVARDPIPAVLITDVRNTNDMKRLRSLGHKVVRVRRREPGLTGARSVHISETMQDDMDDMFFDAVIDNDSSLGHLRDIAITMYRSFLDGEHRSVEGLWLR
jgi:hypothetical protein